MIRANAVAWMLFEGSQVLLEQCAKPLPVIECGRLLVRPFVVDVDGKVPTISGDGKDLTWAPVYDVLNSPVAQVRMMVAGGWLV